MIKTILSKLFNEYLEGVMYNWSHQNERVYYLGPAVFPQWVLATLPFAGLFNKAALKHDTYYAGNGRKGVSRYAADKEFYFDMIAAIDKSSISPLKKTVAWAMAIKYFVAVRGYGWMFWKGD